MKIKNLLCSAAAAVLLIQGGLTMAAEQNNEHSLMGIEARLYQEIGHNVKLDARMRHLIKITALTSVGSDKLMAQSIGEALDAGVKPDEIQEAMVQTMAYSGLARAIDADAILQQVLSERGLKIEVDHGVVTDADRFEKGLTQQKTIFGSGIDTMHANTKDDEKFLNITELTGYCFGDTYTRTGLTLKERELLTFCSITAMGGNWPQVKAHAQGNLNMQTTRQDLIDAITVMMPVIGFPKSLNALAIVKELTSPKQ